MIQQLTIRFHDPSYTSWTLSGEDGVPVVIPGFPPDQLLTGDGLDYHVETGKIDIRWVSPLRFGSVLVGVVVLEGGRSYGKSHSIITTNKHAGSKSGKPLWKCIPLREDLPPFLLAYDPGPTGFSKVLHNRFVSFRFAYWETGHKHPVGLCLASFGPVSSLVAYSDYWLTGHGLFPRPKLTWDPVVEPVVADPDYSVWSLDPPGATLFDDALAIQTLGDEVWVDVCIASVAPTLSRHSIWNSWVKDIQNNVACLPANLYLAGDSLGASRRLSMFPVEWTRMISLQEGSVHEVVRLRLRYAAGSATILSHSFDIVSVNVENNFAYGVERQAGVDRLMAWTRRLSEEGGSGSTEWQQRSMVAYWMTEYNRLAEARLLGSCRLLVGTKGGSPFLNSLQEDMLGGAPVRRGSLRLVSGNPLDTSGWFKSTSPLRRRVDLRNQGFLVSQIESNWVSDYWKDDLEMDGRKLLKWEEDIRVCSRLERCVGLLAWARNQSGKALQGNVLGMRSKGSKEGDAVVKWLVFVEAIGWMTWVLSPVDLVVGDMVPLRIWYFEHESHTHKKVRLEVVRDP